MALGATQFNAPAIVPDFSAGMPMVTPVQVLPAQEAKSPIDTLKEVFFDIRDGIKNLVDQSKEALGLQKEEDREQDIKQSLSDDTITTGEGETKSIIDSLKEQFESLKEGFGNVTIGEKLKAALLIGALALFVKVSDKLVPIVKKIVEGFQFVRDKVFGDTENPNTNTLLSLLGIFAAFKIAPLVKAAGLAVGNLGKATLQLGSKAFTLGKDSLFAAFRGINKAGELAVKGAGKAFSVIEDGFKGLFNALGKGFKNIRLGLVALRTNLAATLVPLAPIIAIAAAIGAVLFSLKSSFEVFKTSLEDGDSMMTAVGKAILDFTASLVTLPLQLAKKLVSFFAGMLGFDGIKEKLDNFSFKDGFINIITGFVDKVKNFFADVLSIDIGGIVSKIGDLGSKVANTLKAIAKGSVAMIAAAAPGGESPTEAFSRVYNEVLSTGTDTPTDVAKSEVADTELEKASTTMAAAKAAVTQDAAYTTNNKVFNTTHNQMQTKIIEILQLQLDLATEKMKNEQEGKSSLMINKGGDTVNQSSNTFQAGTANSDHTDQTAKILTNSI